MKKKEREHLKEDPFQLFIEKALDFLQEYKKQIITAVVAVIVVVVGLSAVAHFKGASVEEENRLLTEALKIQESKDLTVDKKIESLEKLEVKSGISASIRLTIAALYFEKGDFKKAKETLDSFPGSDFRLINDKKKVLEAELLNAQGKNKEALDMFNKIYTDSQSEIAKDFVLFKMSRIQLATGQKETAEANLKKLMEEYPRTMYGYEARTLLAEIGE